MSKERFSKKRFSPVKPLRDRARENGVSISTFKKWLREDWFPRDELVQVGGFGDHVRFGLTDRGQERVQQVLAERAARVIAQPRRISPNLANPKAAAARSVQVRRAKAGARRAERASAS